ncbi:hypothetical protein PPERSA_07270 [Pseudocohnilembus persalinus]|uniref:PABS domain-containing protein n=1 Tax=Pseudocohnilembus persalinus TaxID=266149 RepID=A0A0V0QCY9_PSEPJ|nr:hypothetical protein PPERSA_07270 [Pseudocohnilembus persalinus]|eukprot:KRX00073.1 hypothetical protein PPERSA_07270 [Pseudocohnilembus persalinus]
MFKNFTKLPNLGRNIHLDFTNENQNGLMINYMLDIGHLNYTSFKESNSCSIDLYFSYKSHKENEKKIEKTIETTFEENLSSEIGFENLTTHIAFNRGKYTQLQTNELPEKNEILHDVKFVHKEKTKFQDLKIYDTQDMGRILILDGMVQITNQLEDNYTIDISKEVVNQNSKNILVIGGGDLLVVNHLLKNYPNLQKITQCEIDERVINNVKKYFYHGQQVKKAQEQGKYEIVIDDGANFAAEKARKFSEIYDGIIIDCSDSWEENSPAISLTTIEFYQNLSKLLTNGGGLSQQLSHNDLIPKFQSKWRQVGLSDFKNINSICPEYGGYCPIGCAYKI